MTISSLSVRHTHCTMQESKGIDLNGCKLTMDGRTSCLLPSSKQRKAVLLVSPRTAISSRAMSAIFYHLLPFIAIYCHLLLVSAILFSFLALAFFTSSFPLSLPYFHPGASRFATNFVDGLSDILMSFILRSGNGYC